MNQALENAQCLNEIVGTHTQKEKKEEKKNENFSDATPVVVYLNFIVVGGLRYKACSLPINSLSDL